MGCLSHWDGEVAYAVATDHFQATPTQYALRVDARAGVVERRGIYQSRLPIRSGVIDRGYLWLKTTGYAGPVTIALEEPTSGGGVGGVLQRAGHLTLWHVLVDVRRTFSARGPFGPSPTSNSTESPSRRSLIPSPCTAL